ncbi:DUF4330 family protein [Candidatus Woesearchaeota archaeon]|nr:DUF4330 family protein [Candidatus Woesearchaeota archaeon]
MHLIDDKGKIFGAINVIDLTVLLFVILSGLTFYKYIILQDWPVILNQTLEKFSPQQKIQEPVVKKKITLLVEDQPEFIKDAVKPGLKIYRDNSVAALVESVKIIANKNKYDLVINLLATLEKNQNNLILKNDAIVKINKELKLNTELLDLTGIVVDIKDVEQNTSMD